MTKLLQMLLSVLVLGVTPFSHGNELSAPSQSPIEQVVSNDPVSVTLVSENSSIQPGHSFWVAVKIDIEKNWHAYWKNPGDAGAPPVIKWDLPHGFTVNQTLWPSPKQFSVASSVGFGYDDKLVLLTEITPPPTFSGSSASLKGTVQWVVCSDDTCLPGISEIHADVPVALGTPVVSTSQSTQNLFAQARAAIPQRNEKIAALRKNNLLELVFQDGSQGTHKVVKAEFFPEEKQSINYSTPPLLQQSDEFASQYSVILEEVTPKESLKGVLVLHTSAGRESYEVNIPVRGSGDNDHVASAHPFSTHNKMALTGPGASASADFGFRGGVLLAIVLAFIGGMILNLMPCVLPVISFKILSFIKLSGESRKLIFKHGLAFSGGVLASFWVLASLLLALQAYGRSVGWGFQLQEPLFVAILAAFIFVFGLSLFGLFEFGTSIMTKAGTVQGKAGNTKALFGSFLSGILATALATPCTGPFLGSAVGFAVTLPAYQAMFIFTSLGLGMSFPYLLLTAYPNLLRFLPKPGPWMVTFKEVMGFLMLASVIWLIWVFGAQTGAFSLSLLLGGFFLLSIACWIYGRWGTPASKQMTRRLGTLSAIVFLALGSYTIVASSSDWAQTMSGPITPSKNGSKEVAEAWEPFNPERIVQLRKQGIPVFVDFTAKWCLICQANHLILTRDEVEKKFADTGVVRMKADWTRRDEVISQELQKFGRNSVPLYVLYDGDATSQPKILPQILTPELVIGALDEISGTSSQVALE